MYPIFWVNSVLELGQLSFAFLRPDGVPEVAPLPSNKAHNLFLDTALSVGIWGMLAYAMLLGLGVWGVMRSPYRGIEAIAIVYLIFTFTWFECAQFIHLVWWGLSCVPASRKV